MKIFNGADYEVLASDKFRFFLDFDSFSFPKKESGRGKAVILAADEALEKEIPQLYASVYRLCFTTGDRAEYEKVYFARRNMLISLVFGEIVLNQNKYIDKIIDILWLILEESTWVIPAHNKKDNGNGDVMALPLADDENVENIDLFSAETGAILAFAYYFLHNKFDVSVRSIINDRILRSLNKRIITPFLNCKNMWWMGYIGKKTNNWAPWIVSNVLTVMALTEKDTAKRKRIFDKSLEILDFFISTYHKDGGCDEGPHYWKVAAGALFDCLEIIYDLTDGKANYFGEPLVIKMFDYVRKVNLFDGIYANFSDSRHQQYQDGIPIAVRMGIRTKNSDLINFALPKVDSTFNLNRHMYRCLKNFCFELPAKKEYVSRTFDILENMQVAVIRYGGFHIAAKGGNNDEGHNHNDIGNVIVYADKKPVFIDIGAPTYTKDVFDGRTRYGIFPINSFYHNLPVINGFGQEVGERYFADLFEAKENSIRIEYESAYKEGANVKKCTREIRVTDKETEIIENVVISSGSVLYNYYLVSKPNQNGNVFVLENGTKVSFSDNAKCTFEEILVTDKAICNDWETDKLYKITAEPTGNSEICIKITK